MGGTGTDVLTGHGNANVLDGFEGADTLTGGGGGDVFAYWGNPDSSLDSGGVDNITDFNPGVDKILLGDADGYGYDGTAYTYAGTVAATVADIATHGASDQIYFFHDGADGYVYVQGFGTGKTPSWAAS